MIRRQPLAHIRRKKKRLIPVHRAVPLRHAPTLSNPGTPRTPDTPRFCNSPRHRAGQCNQGDEGLPATMRGSAAARQSSSKTRRRLSPSPCHHWRRGEIHVGIASGLRPAVV
jgi:hypothetical protein